MIVVTDDYYGGEQGFKSILNDYYENAINELPDESQPKARKFIEEGLIVGGRRVGMTEGVEKSRYQIDQDLLDQLLDSRLIRAEITHLGRSFEVSHDTLVEPIVKSYEIRRQIELEAERLAEIRKNRRRVIIATSIAAVGLSLAATTSIFYVRATRSEAKVIVQRDSINTTLTQLRDNLIKNYQDEYLKNIGIGVSRADAANFIEALEYMEAAKQTVKNFVANSGLDSSYVLNISNIDLDSLIRDTEIRGGEKIRFQTLINQGNNLVAENDKKRLVDARQKYREALSTNFNNKLAQDKLNGLEELLRAAFNDFMKNGEVFLNGGRPTRALREFQEAERIYPNDPEVQQKIKASGGG